MTAKKALVHRRRFLKIYALKFCDIWQNFYSYRLLNNETLRVESREPLASFPFPPTQAFLSSKWHAKMQACSDCHATYTYVSWQRSERQNDRSQLILVLTQANANDKLCIRPFCTMFKHCCKLTSALRYHALFLAGSSYQQTMSISLCSMELLIHMNDECFPNTRDFIFSYPKSFVSVTQNLKTREQFRRVTLWELLLFSRVPCGYNSVTSVWHLKQNIACMRDVLKT